MPKLDDLVVYTIALAGGEIVGRIRMQKVIYLLDQLGLESGIQYEYYHYGPYSEAISNAIVDAKFWDLLEEEVKFRDYDGAPYSKFKIKTDVPAPDKLGEINAADARSYLEKFNQCSSTVLELAATVYWLATVEKVANWRDEIKKRKAGKTGNGRLEKALQLLEDIDLRPA